MPSKATDKFADRWAARRRKRSRKRAKAVHERRGRGKIALKAIGVAVLVAVLVALALFVGDSDYHVTVVGWLPLFVVVLAILASLLDMELVKRNLVFSEHTDVHECDRDSDVHFAVDFDNRSPAFAFSLSPRFYISDLFGNRASEATTSLALSPFQHTQLGFTTRFEHVGTYEAGFDQVAIGDLVGLFSAVRKNDRHQRIRVLPKIVPIAKIHFSMDAVEETLKPQRAVMADSMNYASVREYVPGDPLKAIHWKLSARQGEYLTRLYEMYTNPGVAVIMDFYAKNDDAKVMMSLFDAVMESAFSVAQYACENGMDTEVLYRDRQKYDRVVTTWTRETMSEIVDNMPVMSNDPADAAASVEILKRQATSTSGQNNLVVCSASLDSALISALIEAKLRGRAPMLICAVPSGIVDKDREVYCAPLSRLDSADVPYLVISKSSELRGMVA